jgi:hypothetical protein
MTQFGRALAESNIEIICANSSQASGVIVARTAPYTAARIQGTLQSTCLTKGLSGVTRQKRLRNLFYSRSNCLSGHQRFTAIATASSSSSRWS